MHVKYNLYICSNKKTNIMNTLVNYTNARLNNWYSSVKKEYGIIGSAKSEYNAEDDTLSIFYTENNITRKFTVLYVSDQKIDFAFNVWGEMADEEDEIVN